MPDLQQPAGRWKLTLLYAAQLLGATLLLLAGYHLAHAGSVAWAIISVAVVLQPGLQESRKTSLNRIAANIVGAAVALGVGTALGAGLWQFLLALTATVFACAALNLDQSLRAACVTVTVVMLLPERSLVISALERACSVTIGCAMALAVETLTVLIVKRARSAPA